MWYNDPLLPSLSRHAGKNERIQVSFSPCLRNFAAVPRRKRVKWSHVHGAAIKIIIVYYQHNYTNAVMHLPMLAPPLPGEVSQSWGFDLIRIQLPHPPGNIRIQIPPSYTRHTDTRGVIGDLTEHVYAPLRATCIFHTGYGYIVTHLLQF